MMPQIERIIGTILLSIIIPGSLGYLIIDTIKHPDDWKLPISLSELFSFNGSKDRN